MIVGVNQMTEVLLPALKKMGTAVKMGGVAELLLETQQEATTIKTARYGKLIKAAIAHHEATILKSASLDESIRRKTCLECPRLWYWSPTPAWFGHSGGLQCCLAFL